MQSNRPPHLVPSFFTRHYIGLLTVLALLFIVQTGVVPFDFDAPGTPESHALFAVTFDRLTVPDTVSNIFLYVPVGCLVFLSLRRYVPSGLLVFFMTVVLSGCLSALIEWIQAYSPSRVSSIIDLTSNILGALLGALLAWLFRSAVPRLFLATAREFRIHPLPSIGKVFALLLVICAAIPFSFTLDVGRLKQRAKQVNLVPFAAGAYDLERVEEARDDGNFYVSERAQWERMKRWSRWPLECASFIVLAWMLHLILRGDYGFGRFTAAVLSCWLGGAMACALTIMQFFIMSRACDITDVLFRLAGLMIGIATQALFLSNNGRPSAAVLWKRWNTLLRFACGGAVVFILYNGIIPLTINTSQGGWDATVSAPEFLPFFAYLANRLDIMLADVIEKCAMYALFAALLAVAWSRTSGKLHSPRIFSITACGVAIAAIIEIVQMYILVRVACLTDIILAAAGCITGTLAHQLGVWYYCAVFDAQGAVRGTAIPQSATPAVSEDLSPTDALVGSLIDPHPDAPLESTPRPRRPVHD